MCNYFHKMLIMFLPEVSFVFAASMLSFLQFCNSILGLVHVPWQKLYLMQQYAFHKNINKLNLNIANSSPPNVSPLCDL